MPSRITKLKQERLFHKAKDVYRALQSMFSIGEAADEVIRLSIAIHGISNVSVYLWRSNPSIINTIELDKAFLSDHHQYEDIRLQPCTEDFPGWLSIKMKPSPANASWHTLHSINLKPHWLNLTVMEIMQEESIRLSEAITLKGG